jgi:HK97 gp10 family phage protein
MDIQINGLNELVAAFIKAKAEFPKQFRNAMTNSVVKIRTTAQSLVPVKTGMLKKSITMDISGTPPIGKVMVGQPYGKYVEYGTAPHTIVPVRAKALRFAVGGDIVFAKKVNHPGTKGKPFMEPALENNKGYIQDQFTRAMQAVVQMLASK